MTATLDRAVDAITTALDARDLPAARTAFDKAVGGDQAAVEPLVRRLAETVALPPGMVVYGFAIDMFANPHRERRQVVGRTARRRLPRGPSAHGRLVPGRGVLAGRRGDGGQLMADQCIQQLKNGRTR